MGVLSWNFLSMNYGSQWKRCRRLFHEFLNANAVSRFDDYLNKNTCRLLSRLAETPDDFMGHIRLLVLPRTAVIICLALTPIPSASGALIMEITYGMDIKSHEDKYLQTAVRALDHLGDAFTPGKFLVDTLPICLSPNPRIPVPPG